MNSMIGARQGSAGLGEAGQGMAGKARRGVARLGKARRGMAGEAGMVSLQFRGQRKAGRIRHGCKNGY